jgi:hypothetical protein
MILTTKEEQFLQAWMYDELHFREGVGQAKQLQREHQVRPADLGTLIAAWLPDPKEQLRRAEEPLLPSPPEWPWQSRKELEARLHEAQAELSEQGSSRKPVGKGIDEHEHPLQESA